MTGGLWGGLLPIASAGCLGVRGSEMPSSAVAEHSRTPGLPSVPPPSPARGLFSRRQRARLEEEAARLRRARRELDSKICALVVQRLRAIDEALDAIAVGDYGICIDCDKEIPRRRLELTPWARRCVACQAAVETGEAK